MSDELDPAVRSALERVGAAGHDLRRVRRPGLPRPLERWHSADLIVEVALDDDGRRRNLLEVRGHRWAATQGVPTPEVLASEDGGGWLITRRVRTQGASGPAYVAAALEVADRIAAATLPPPAEGGLSASSWRAPRRTALARQVRGVVAGVPLRLWLAARAQVRRLPARTTAHGDYYRRNVLADADGGVRVVDWEFMAPAPRYSDAMRFWTLLRRREDRDLVLERLLGRADREERREIGAQGLWLALRLLGENAKAPRRLRTPEDLAHAWAVLPEARTLARELDAWPL